MRSISVSTDVFAKIWAQRRDGEDSEDAILRRVFGAPPARPSTAALETNGAAGFYSKRFDVRFPEGFEIFRNFKGTDYRARATGGHWQLQNDGEAYGSLSELSGAVGAKIENAWANWFFTDEAGERRPISVLRPASKVARRTK
jgi:hypothetical protein